MTTSGDRPRRPSITDVARRAGVSVGTVSNVLNRPDHVASSTRDRVQAVIEDLGFVRNASARQLRVGSANMLGVLVLDLANPFFTGIARGVEDRIAPEDYTLVLSSSDADTEREARYLRLHEEHGVQGILVSPARASIDQVLAVRDRGMQVVLLDASADVTEISSVGVDDVRGGALATEHLLALGHRRIGLVNGPGDVRPCADRRAGTVAALTAAGLDPGKVLAEVTVPAMTADAGDAAMTELLALGPARRPTATFCTNDLLALGALRALRRAGVAVPEQMAVVGYDDIPVLGLLPVPLTSVRQPTHTLGWTAADLLLREAAAGRGVEHQRVLFQPELVVRASTAGAAAPDPR
ncbi:LacI family DNA-binding transcriptional regulator [Cellulomonas sp. zg-ZUI222]|uniref:LacI family DNA-binding transcriptional regulator n=1 Tax=Cellulomonas wangleii TaxID=2816956 RepID=A0ABX8D7S6_9CELL|nr:MULTISPECIES: LacI family DNA-binding transcriptional regulator [Cellulomonas]MBO0899252.1 LacI family DNA-binding transcriptional regulator [Cellulomonas sp. zg-ZUI22]MBO0920103.1 LacI family DNA-binding transcriptional regulator [Cellulomonas wangleii]MBO0923468.1 LacI family DNA-binding transcriptional regulator [Cellulomonas wangleii]QVI61812.1 LacI family DNA-binding transcriptional regulator [Cellulomonas wangleii]